MKPIQDKKIRSRVIFAQSQRDLENKINDWLEDAHYNTIIDIQYSVAMTTDQVDIYSTYSVLIIYIEDSKNG